MIRLKMKNYNTILKEKQQKHRALSSGNIGKYEFFTGEEILPSDQSRIIEQAKFTYSALGKVFENQNKKQTNKKRLSTNGEQSILMVKKSV